MWLTDLEEQAVLNSAVGRTVKRVRADDDITLDFDTGPSLRLWLDGDCCSHSYFTDDAKTDAEELVGRKIVAIEERDDAGAKSREYPDQNADEYIDAIKWHFLVITTDKGHVTLDWRNDSNGYYDGTLHPSLIGKS